jgi:RNA polymerase sigma-70 factor (ECF subfamily)
MNRPVPTDWDWGAARAICLRETRRLLRNGQEAEDAAQEAILRAWRARKRCQSSDAFAPWLRVIATNEARRYGARTSRLAKRETHDEETDQHPAADEIGARLDALACRQMLAPLTGPERELMLLRYVEGLTQAQIAARLGVPEGTVKVRLHRSRARLRKVLE